MDRDILMRFHWGLGVGHAHSHGLMSVGPDEQSNVRSLDRGQDIQNLDEHDSNQDENRNYMEGNLDKSGAARNGDDLGDSLDGGNGNNVDGHLDKSNKMGGNTNEMEGDSVDHVESHNGDYENEEEEEEDIVIVLEELEELEELDMDEMYGDRDADDSFSYN